MNPEETTGEEVVAPEAATEGEGEVVEGEEE